MVRVVVTLLYVLLWANISAQDNDTYVENDHIIEIDKLIAKDQIEEAIRYADKVLKNDKTGQKQNDKTRLDLKVIELKILQGDFTGAKHSLDDIKKQILSGTTPINNGLFKLHSAQYFMNFNQYEEAEAHFSQSIIDLSNLPKYLALAWNERGYNAALRSQNSTAAEYYLKALKLYEEMNHLSGKAMVLNNLSVMYHNIQQTHLAISYARQSIEIREQIKDYKGLGNGYCNLSQMYLTSDLNQAERYANLCLEVSKKLNNQMMNIAGLHTIGLVKNYKGEKSEWLEQELEILKILKSKGEKSQGVARQQLSIAVGMNEALMDSVATLQLFNESLALAAATGDRETVRDCYGHINIFYRLRNDLNKAYPYLRKYHAIKDSLINEKTVTNIVELQTRYETSKKDAEILKLNDNQRIKNLTIENQKVLLIAEKELSKRQQIELDLALQKEKFQQAELENKKEALASQILLNQNQKQQLDLANSQKLLNLEKIRNQKQSQIFLILLGLAGLISALFIFSRYKLKKKIEEQNKLIEIRDSIARDLHDEVGSTLSSIKILSQVTAKNVAKDHLKSEQLLEKIIQQSESMQSSLTDIVWSVNPANDKFEDILPKIKDFINSSLELNNVTVTIDIDPSIATQTLAMNERKEILYSLKEAINNVARHSKANKAHVGIHANKNTIHIIVEDNGRGFDQGIMNSNGNGLKNMKKRIESIGGNVFYNSSQNGSKVLMKIPNKI